MCRFVALTGAQRHASNDSADDANEISRFFFRFLCCVHSFRTIFTLLSFDLVELMQRCWDKDKDKRPSAPQVLMVRHKHHNSFVFIVSNVDTFIFDKRRRFAKCSRFEFNVSTDKSE
jgi:hypothetical protein